MIESEIVQRRYYKKGVLIHQLSGDKVFDKALELLRNPDSYHSVLQPKPANIPPAKEIKEKLKDQYSTNKNK